ncbi:MAG TPA: PASTA domain-containing protein [Acidimicrobiales bacterium]|nr:PASTA domain-containing protein [Acidimicrobiales bacterium]
MGLPKSEVYAAMRRAQLYFVTRGPGSATGTWRSAAALRPRAGAKVAWHSTVTVTVSMAPGHALVRVPRLVGRTRAQVYAAMRRAQLYFVTRGPGSASGRWVAVTAQRPRAGTPVRWHSTVSLSVSTRRPVRHPPTTTTTRPRRTTTTTRPRPAPTTSTTPPTTYPGETTTTGATTTTAVTTTTKPATAAKRTPPKPHRYRFGVATWYDYIPGRCATSYLPFGTRIHVRDLRNGRTVTCVVTDREGRESKGSNRIVDLSETQFAELAPLRVGVIPVKVSW